ncbi:MAG: hypothetical protein AAFQ94_16950 [Bacteroidota bacterium]
MTLTLTTEQVNLILNALAQQPYIQVHETIQSIQQQGQQQLNAAATEVEPAPKSLKKSS